MNAKISVVVPTYRRPQLLSKCLQALSVQDIKPLTVEVIVVSDGPDAATRNVVERYKNFMQVIYLALPEKKGPAAARNLGWRHGGSILVAFTDDDCLPARDWLTTICNAYQPDETIAFTGSVKVPLTGVPTDFEKNTQGLERADFVTANCALSRTALERVGGFDEDFSMAWREDSDLEFKLFQQQIPIVRLDDAMVLHPVRTAPWGVSMREQKKGMFDALLYKKFPALFKQRIRPVSPWNYYLIISLFTAMLIGLWLHNNILALIGGIGWVGLIIKFILTRLTGTSGSRIHVSEMIVTSLAIPFLSVYWQLYGAIKYKVLFI